MSESPLIGRHRELKRFRAIEESNEAAFLAVYGRRRVGKTFLIREATRTLLAFELTGMQEGTLREQLDNFTTVLGKASAGKFPKGGPPKSWQNAFHELEAWAATLSKKKTHYLFFDELPWLAAPRSRFLSALGYFWNTWVSRQPHINLVVCGSAASWMIRKLLHDRGGLHNRVTHRIRLEPFDLADTRDFLKSRRIPLNDQQTIELYMAIGGIPFYLEQATSGKSAAQIIDATCFAKDGILRDEFDKLYPALFESPERHIEIVRALAKKPSGLTRGQIAKASKQSPSGRFTTTLNELEESGFISSSPPFGKLLKDTLYRLTDEYSLFYLRWIEPQRGSAKGTWTKLRGTPRWRAWSGYTFEGICHKHIAQIKHALGISGIATQESSWLHKPTTTDPEGAQIDLLIDRADACIDLCEIKFTDGQFVIDKRYAAHLRERRETFRRSTKTKKNLFLTFITTHGIKQNPHALEVVSSSIKMEALFKRL